MSDFYYSIINGEDVVEAFNSSLKVESNLYHCETMLGALLINYVREQCQGVGKEERVERLVKERVNEGAARNRAERRRDKHSLTRRIKPTQYLIDKYVKSFLGVKSMPLPVSHIVDAANSGMKIDARKLVTAEIRLAE